MADDQDDKARDLRRLAKRYGITIQSPPNAHLWPAVHRGLFESLRKVGDQKFDNFSASIDIRSNDEPWREQTKHRAEWLAKRAAHLFNQQRNEAGWRFGLENDVLRRFSVEVACPKCWARIWRSEIEACVNELDEVTANLEGRRKRRRACTCAPNDRPNNYYEIGTNPLFDDRTQEVIIHDPLLRSQLPKQEPDRVYGLQETDNFEKLLSSPVPSTPGNDADITLRELVRSSPFKDGVEPLLFPFLVLEAKSGKSSSGFFEIQTQTAFPIFALLKLQEDLLARLRASGTADVAGRPLIWFLANRGDAWKVYGCCISESEPTRYDIFHLWDGSIMSKDSSLQLLLIVDYIFDWARDIYRPYVLRQLKSLVTGSTFDQISLTDDSDIMSMRRNISNWIQAAPSTIAGPDFEQDFGAHDSAPHLDHQSLLGISIPNTKLGTLRSASLAESRIEGLFITEQNVAKLLQLAGAEDSARQLINFLAKWNELLVLTGDALDELEETWIGRSRFATGPSAPSTSSQFYVLMEVKTFINISWTIVRQLTYIAVSKEAFEIIFTHANFKLKNDGPQLVTSAARFCSKKVLVDTLRCLLSGSPSQVFATATTCVFSSLYALPEKKRSDYAAPIETLAFGTIRRSRLHDFIQKFHKISQRKLKKKPNRQHLNILPAPEDLSFIRNSEETRFVSEKDLHDENQCSRCTLGSKYNGKPYHFTASNSSVFSAYGLELVVSLNLTTGDSDKHDICLFAVSDLPEVADDKELAVIVEDLLQSRHGYHTIRHPPQSLSRSFIIPEDTLWNLPLHYRPFTGKQRFDLKNWVSELKGLPISAPAKKRETKFCWDELQMLLHYFGKGKTWAEAVKEIDLKDRQGRTMGYCRQDLYRQSEKDDNQRRKDAGEIVVPLYDRARLGRTGPFLESTRGDDINLYS
ncbi:1,4-alpha-glucan branching enzyme protein [Rutstroemia sp. NJR-2017a WRK4]|nr:1,4-alpha-glucan branching enzyme protein [Rutstroemia sp. NJR-2017a WRK4]